GKHGVGGVADEADGAVVPGIGGDSGEHPGRPAFTYRIENGGESLVAAGFYARRTLVERGEVRFGFLGEQREVDRVAVGQGIDDQMEARTEQKAGAAEIDDSGQPVRRGQRAPGDLAGVAGLRA